MKYRLSPSLALASGHAGNAADSAQAVYDGLQLGEILYLHGEVGAGHAVTQITGVESRDSVGCEELMLSKPPAER